VKRASSSSHALVGTEAVGIDPEGAAVDVALGEEAAPALVSVTGEGEDRALREPVRRRGSSHGDDLGRGHWLPPATTELA